MPPFWSRRSKRPSTLTPEADLPSPEGMRTGAGSSVPDSELQTSPRRGVRETISGFLKPQRSSSRSPSISGSRNQDRSPTPTVSRIPSPSPVTLEPQIPQDNAHQVGVNHEGSAAGPIILGKPKGDAPSSSSTLDSKLGSSQLVPPNIVIAPADDTGARSNTRDIGVQKLNTRDSQLAVISQPPARYVQGHKATALWIEAYNKLPPQYKTELDNLDKLQVLRRLQETAHEVMEKCVSSQWRVSWGGKEINVRDAAEKLMSWITRFRDVGDIAVQYDPVHAALPWAGVRFILTLVIGEQELLAAAIVGMERITLLIGRCVVYEQLYLIQVGSTDIPRVAQDATYELCDALLALYTTILQVECQLIKIFANKHILQNLKYMTTVPNEIKELDGPESRVDTAVMVVESCYHSYTRNHDKEQFDKLRKLLEDSHLATSELEITTKEIYRDIKDTERITILKWLSTVPYQSHHDLACDGRVEGTGEWLFQRKEFIHWQQSGKAEILWLHGIPGAGKTKLVSATIEALKGNVDKVVFFYCKRDEEDRRDRHKILLAFLKQLACPPKGTGIHAQVVDIWNKEQEDPGARKHLTPDASLTLLASLLQSYHSPILVLDALDECTQDSRGLILRDLLSLINKSEAKVKVFISSRHSLDIEDRLRDLPHVCIEATDNATDIENYIIKELALRVKEGKLLRGKVSQNLHERIQDVLIRGANGMFLWVDYQIRQLCNIRLEHDIRLRLGKLPKDLTGVYDEIMNSIQSQIDSGPQLAERALKWMLVATRPLAPEELVTAIEIDPTIPLPNTDSTPSQRHEPYPSSLGIDDVIDFCGGLILRDTELDVLRFAHLSVQEYLEERNKAWDIIDAHLHVAECSLWVLQNSQTLASISNTSFYYYVALNWFRHCSSYQDLVLDCQLRNLGTKPRHKLDLPLLNSFLWPFDDANKSFCRWIEWLDEKFDNPTIDSYNDLELIRKVKTHILSKPVRSIFAAAFSGLGVLVDWLWHLEGLDGTIQNSVGVPLLDIAAEYGSRWMIERILENESQTEQDKRLGEIGYTRSDYYGSALCAALENRKADKITLKLLIDRGGNINGLYRHYGSALLIAAMSREHDIVRLLLDNGADINIVGGPYGTALGVAAYIGEEDIVRLLLDRGADINIVGGMYGTVLSTAAYRGKEDIVRLLLDRGADMNIVNGMYGTVLGTAVYGGKEDIVRLLLDRGADINIVGGIYGTVLITTAYRGEEDIVRLLLDRGADINIVGRYYGTALGAAAYGGEGDIVRLLLDRGADINIVGGPYGTALGAAACRGERDIVRLLLDQGADINILGGKYGTALSAAANKGKEDIVRLLLDRGADINIVGGYYGTALGAAACRGEGDIVRLLLDRGVDINIVGGDYGTALGAAAYGGKGDIVRLLLDRGADMDIVGGEYGTALGAAAYGGKGDIVRLLLDRGADVNIVGGKYGKALGAAEAQEEDNSEVIALLLARGARRPDNLHEDQESVEAPRPQGTNTDTESMDIDEGQCEDEQD